MNDMFKDILIRFILVSIGFIVIPIIATTIILIKIFDINIILSLIGSIALFYSINKNIMYNCIEDKNKLKLLRFLSLITVLFIVLILILSNVNMLLLKAVILGFIICISQHILGIISFKI